MKNFQGMYADQNSQAEIRKNECTDDREDARDIDQRAYEKQKDKELEQEQSKSEVSRSEILRRKTIKKRRINKINKRDKRGELK